MDMYEVIVATTTHQVVLVCADNEHEAVTNALEDRFILDCYITADTPKDVTRAVSVSRYEEEPS